ncbi:MAG TPA: hypothetical protein VF986_01955 [Actinomycetota bacterium]
MQQTAKHARSRKRPGLIRRLVGGKPGKVSPRSEANSTADILDLVDAGGTIAIARIERLEKGMQLMAETMKVTYGRLTAAVEDVRRHAVRAPTTGEVRRVPAPTARHLGGFGPRPIDGGVIPVVPHERERPDEDLDALTALRRARFAETEADGP